MTGEPANNYKMSRENLIALIKAIQSDKRLKKDFRQNPISILKEKHIDIKDISPALFQQITGSEGNQQTSDGKLKGIEINPAKM